MWSPTERMYGECVLSQMEDRVSGPEMPSSRPRPPSHHHHWRYEPLARPLKCQQFWNGVSQQYNNLILVLVNTCT